MVAMKERSAGLAPEVQQAITDVLSMVKLLDCGDDGTCKVLK